MLGEDIGSEQRRSAKPHDFHRELLLCSYARRHRISALAARDCQRYKVDPRGKNLKAGFGGYGFRRSGQR